MSCEKNHLNLHKYHLPYVLIGIFPGYPQASDFDCRISMVSFIVRYLPVNLVPLRFFVGVQFNLVIQQTIVCHGFICLVVFKQICHGKHGVKIILGVIKRKPFKSKSPQSNGFISVSASICRNVNFSKSIITSERC